MITKVCSRKGSSSWYIGVRKHQGKFETQIRVNGTYHYIGTYDNEHEAGRAYNRAVDKYCNGERTKNIIGVDNRSNEHRKVNYINKSNIRYKGVYYNSSRFQVKIQFDKKQVNCGGYDTEEKAALVYNIVTSYLKGDYQILNDVPMTEGLMQFIKSYQIPDKILNLKKVLSKYE
ncbi:TPA: hypothetical protein P6V00_001493 [Staphylococcus aureus]|nr:hypothetical protein [Staphylococcus aureus]